MVHNHAKPCSASVHQLFSYGIWSATSNAQNTMKYLKQNITSAAGWSTDDWGMYRLM